MNKFGLALILAVLCTCAHAQSYSRCKVLLNGKNVSQLAARGLDTEHGQLVEERFFISDFSDNEIRQIQNAGFQTEIIIPDVKKWYVEQNHSSKPFPDEVLENTACGNTSITDLGNFPTPENYTAGTMGGYHRYEEILAVLDDMHTKFPQFITQRAIVSDTILTHDGRPLWWVKISDNPNEDENEPEALYTAMHHCREPLGMTQLLYYMWNLMEKYNSDPATKFIVDNTELYFIPCLNPDGYIYNETTDPQGGGLWRKNRRDNGDGTFGVDLNRNYGLEWGYDNIGSSPMPDAATYRGPAPFSEPESRMVRDFSLAHSFKNGLNYHSYSNLLIYPWAYNNQIGDPYLPYLSEAINLKSNYKAGTTIETVGYNVNGSSDDWLFGTQGMIIYTPECGPPSLGFWPPASKIDSLNKVSQFGNYVLAWSLHHFGLAKDISADFITTQVLSVPVQISNYGAQDGPFTVKMQGLSANILEISPAEQVANILQQTRDTVWFTVKLSENITPGSDVLLALSLDNNSFTLTDTLLKVYKGVGINTLYSSAFDDPQNWNGDWGITDEEYFTPPTCLTDSPGTSYGSNAARITELETPIIIPADAFDPYLSFDAKWFIEDNYDWVQIEIIDDATGQSTRVCGKYSNAGTIYQGLGEPLWDGLQEEWVKEHIDLNPFKGKNIRILFALFSDNGLHRDGFYLDNLEVAYYDTTQSSGSHTLLQPNPFIITPNPASETIRAEWTNPGHSVVQHVFVLNNLLGQEVFRQVIPSGYSGNVQLDISQVPNGLYTWNIQASEGVYPGKCLMIQH